MNLPEIKFSDGRTARFIRKPKAGDASRAYRIAGAKGTDIDRNAALLAQIVQFDGQTLVMEEVLQVDLDDFGKLVDVIQYGRWDTGHTTDETEQGGDPGNFSL